MSINIIFLIDTKNFRTEFKEFVYDHFSYLKEYCKRNNSEGGFSDDKRLCGWKIWQKREDRIDLALMGKGIWHNLMWMG